MFQGEGRAPRPSARSPGLPEPRTAPCRAGRRGLAWLGNEGGEPTCRRVAGGGERGGALRVLTGACLCRR